MGVVFSVTGVGHPPSGCSVITDYHRRHLLAFPDVQRWIFLGCFFSWNKLIFRLFTQLAGRGEQMGAFKTDSGIV